MATTKKPLNDRLHASAQPIKNVAAKRLHTRAAFNQSLMVPRSLTIASLFRCYFTEVLWWVCVYVCLSVREDISGTTRTIFTIFVYAVYGRPRLRFMLNAWLHVRVINFRIIIIIMVVARSSWAGWRISREGAIWGVVRAIQKPWQS